jgi:hypothetical protein
MVDDGLGLEERKAYHKVLRLGLQILIAILVFPIAVGWGCIVWYKEHFSKIINGVLKE